MWNYNLKSEKPVYDDMGINRLIDILKRTAEIPAWAFTLLAAMSVLASCGKDLDPPADKPAGECLVTFTITVNSPEGNTPRDTRATTPKYDYVAGDTYENRLDIENGDFRFYFFESGQSDKEDVKFITAFKVEEVKKVGEDNTIYRVTGKLPDNIDGLKAFTLVALANWGEYPDLTENVSTLSDLWKNTGDANNGNTVFKISKDRYIPPEPPKDLTDYVKPHVTNRPIPFFGIRKYDNVSFSYNGLTDLGSDKPIYMLRAYAKVEVLFDEECFDVDKIEVTRVNLNGFKAPKGLFDHPDYVASGKYLPDDAFINIPSLTADDVATDVPMDFMERFYDEAGKKWWTRYMIYLPEYINVGDDVEHTRLHVFFHEPGLSQDEVYYHQEYFQFGVYDAPAVAGNPSVFSGKYFNIQRNVWYRFTIRKTGLVDVEKLLVTVEDWVEDKIHDLDSKYEGIEEK